MNIRRVSQVFEYGWKDSLKISSLPQVNKTRIQIFLDILWCFLKYNVWSNQYTKMELFRLQGDAKMEKCLHLKEKNDKHDLWIEQYFSDYRFLIKWSDFKYEKSPNMQKKRREAYAKRFGLGKNSFVGYGVIIQRHHQSEAKIVTGRNCLISEQVVIDYSGGLVLGEAVAISEGTKILTHNHELSSVADGEYKRECVFTPLVIHDNVWIGARAMILPGVTEIGRGAMIGAGAVIKNKIPPYAIMMGNPAKIVGFVYTPDEVEQIESSLPDEKKTDVNKYRKNYDKYFIGRIVMIKEQTNN